MLAQGGDVSSPSDRILEVRTQSVTIPGTLEQRTRWCADDYRLSVALSHVEVATDGWCLWLPWHRVLEVRVAPRKRSRK